MTFLSDKALEKLRSAGELPDFRGTRYANLQFLARGGMGAVYAADDQTLERRVAIKILDALDPDGSPARPLSNEARVLAQLEHPGVVPVHDSGVLSDGRAFYVMKFVQGARLDQFLAGVAEIPERLRLFLRVSEAVSFAHSHGVLHRDLKPSNIMVGSFGEVLVMDWGVAKILRPSSTPSSKPSAHPQPPTATQLPASTAAYTEDGIVVGTPGFMSPEQAEGRSSALDARSDIYSLGKLLEYVVLREPANQKTRVPKPLRAISARAAAADPNDRYASVSDLADDVRRFLDGRAVSAYSENPWERTKRFYLRNQAAILLITTYLLVRTLFQLYGRH